MLYDARRNDLVFAQAGNGEKWQTPKPGIPRAHHRADGRAGLRSPQSVHVHQADGNRSEHGARDRTPKQLDEAKAKLTKAAAKFGRKPNFLVFLLDDVGWIDPGFNGGGEHRRQPDAPHG